MDYYGLLWMIMGYYELFWQELSHLSALTYNYENHRCFHFSKTLLANYLLKGVRMFKDHEINITGLVCVVGTELPSLGPCRQF